MFTARGVKERMKTTAVRRPLLHSAYARNAENAAVSLFNHEHKRIESASYRTKR